MKFYTPSLLTTLNWALTHSQLIHQPPFSQNTGKKPFLPRLPTTTLASHLVMWATIKTFLFHSQVTAEEIPQDSVFLDSVSPLDK